MKIGIIGGGASGLFAAINVKTGDNEVIIFERNKTCGKKLLATGNGRCNYWNSDQQLYHYQSQTPELIEKIINKTTEEKVLEIFDKLGIVPKIKNGYYYPFSNQAGTILNVLLEEVNNKKIVVKNNFLVSNIEKHNEKFVISSDTEKVSVDKLIISTGSFSLPKSGSDGMGYDFLKGFGHTIIKPLPALVQLRIKGNFLKEWNGVRTDVKLSLFEDDKLIKEESGEIQLTDYGISGICTFNLSNIVSRGLDKNKKEEISINFLPFIDCNIYNWFIEKTSITGKNIKNLLKGILNDKLVNVILKKSNINSSKTFTDLSDLEKDNLINSCISFKVLVTSTNSFEKAQVCSGGVTLSEINLNTMESKKDKNLYIIGELLDITGDCGGYNLGIAWRSAYIAGNSIRSDSND